MDIGIGIVGYGMIAKTHLLGIQASRVLWPDAPHAYARALCTRRPEQCQELPFTSIYTEPKRLFEDEKVQIVDICTPNSFHASVAIDAMRAGKCVYVEKPLSNSLIDAKQMCNVAKETCAINQTALILRFRPVVNRVKDLLQSGSIGDVIHFRGCFFHGSYLDPKRPISWRQQMATAGGGAMMDLGVHLLDMVRYVIGDVEEISAKARTVCKERYTDNRCTEKTVNDTDEYMCATLTMQNGSLGIIESSRISTSAYNNETLEIFGTNGSIFLDFDKMGRVVLTEAGGRGSVEVNGSHPGASEKEALTLLPEQRQSLGPFVDVHTAAIKNICNWFVQDKMFSGTPTFEDGYQAQLLVQQCIDSAECNKKQD